MDTDERAGTAPADEYSNPVGEPAPLGRVARALAVAGAVNPDRLAHCSADDRQAAIRTGLAVLLAFAFVWLVNAVGLSIAFGSAGVGWPAIAAVAALLAGIVLLIDHTLVQALWSRSGLDHVCSRGFEVDGAPSRRGSGFALGGLRVGLAVVSSYVAATTLTLVVFAPEIEQRIQGDFGAANVAVADRAAAKVAGVLSREATEVEAARADVERAAQTEAALEKDANDAAITQAKARRERMTAVASRRDALQVELARRRRDAIAEETGVCQSRDQSCRKGKGDRYTAAVQSAELAQRELTTVEAELAKLQPEADAPAVAAALRDARDRTAAARARYEHLAEEYVARLARREADVQAAMEADAAYQPRVDGLIARLRALGELASDPATAAFI